MSENIDLAVSIVNEVLQSETINCYALTGAGISKNSGIPTFRGEGGLWEKLDVMEVASIDSWRKKPEELWVLLKEGMQQIYSAKPNAAHEALALLEEKQFCQTIITQNADSLHQKAGSRNVIEIHGNLTKIKCFQCEKVEDFNISEEVPPKCSACGGMMRPAVTLFNEAMPEEALHQAFSIAKKANLVLIIGTSAEVYPAAGLPLLSRRNKAKIIVFNADKTEHVQLADVFVQGKCEETLPVFVDYLLKG